jgi:hypothetical protein
VLWTVLFGRAGGVEAEEAGREVEVSVDLCLRSEDGGWLEARLPPPRVRSRRSPVLEPLWGGGVGSPDRGKPLTDGVTTTTTRCAVPLLGGVVEVHLPLLSSPPPG